MNQKEAMAAVVAAIMKTNTTAPGKKYLYYKSGKFAVKTRRSDEEKIVKIATFTSIDIMIGLKSNLWEKIESTIRILIEKGKI